MSGLAGILAGHTAPGVYHWHTGLPSGELEHTLKVAGWSLAHLDSVVETKEEVLAAIGEALSFPDHYGRNLDALWDCLGDVAEPTVLLWDTWGPAAYADQGVFTKVLTVLKERAAKEPGFTVLLRGDGPDVGLPELA